MTCLHLPKRHGGGTECMGLWAARPPLPSEALNQDPAPARTSYLVRVSCAITPALPVSLLPRALLQEQIMTLES